MNKRWFAGGVALVLLALVGAWALGWLGRGDYSDDPQVAELEKMRDAAVARGLPTDGQPPRPERDAWRQKMQGLTPEQQAAFWESSAPIFVPLMAKAFEARYDKFMAMSPEEQRRELDKQIDQMEAGSRNRAAGDSPGGDRRGGPRNADPKKIDEFRKKMNAWTTPEQRAKFENGIRIFNERRKERGLQPVSPGGGRGML
jgi:hypothetical protein